MSEYFPFSAVDSHQFTDLSTLKGFHAFEQGLSRNDLRGFPFPASGGVSSNLEISWQDTLCHGLLSSPIFSHITNLCEALSDSRYPTISMMQNMLEISGVIPQEPDSAISQ